MPSKDAGPLAFNADASSPLIPHGLPPTRRPRSVLSSEEELPSLDKIQLLRKRITLLVLGVTRFVQRDYALVSFFLGFQLPVLGKYQCFFVSDKRLGVFIKFHEGILREEFYDVASERRNARVRN